MADSLDQRLIDKVVARMQTITVAHGYNTDIGVTVRDSEVNWDETELPAVSVFEGKVMPEPNADNLTFCTRLMPVMIRVAFKRKDDTALDAKYARHCIQDILKAVGTDKTFDKLAMTTNPGEHGIEYADAQNLEITGASVEIIIGYHSQKFNLEA